MLKVNSEKLLGEIARLQGEIADNDLRAFNEAKAIGEQRGWSDVLISAFADILLKEEAAFDISAKKKTLDYLMLFVEEVADEPVEEEVVPAPAPVEEVAPEVVEQPAVTEAPVQEPAEAPYIPVF
nr:MAG TPA: hypothetical protein [Caudoviricetes sp.]